MPVLQVVVPLVAAPACLLLAGARLAWGLALVVGWATFAIAALLLDAVLAHGPVSYALGGWAAPWGIEYRIDAANAFVLVIVAGIGALMLPFARASVDREIPREKHALFYTAYLLALAGLLGVTITGDAFNLFVFLEIASLSSYVLVSLGSDRRALVAAYRYLVMGTIGATFIVIGIGFLYAATGTLNMADLARRAQDQGSSRTVLAAFGFISVGAALKLALFPLHQWLPNAYARAPSVVSAFLAATGTKVGIYILLRFTFTVFGVEFAFGRLPLAEILLPLSLAAAFIASLIAIFEHDVKRMLAYSSVAQVGYMTLGISFASAAGLAATLIHLFNHALIKGAAFLALGCVFYRLGSTHMERMAGLGRRMPATMAAFVAAGLSLIGTPLTVGFISKWYLVTAALEGRSWVVAALVLLSSLLAVVYVWRVVETAYFRPASADADAAREAPLGLLAPTWLLIALNIYFGIDSSLTTGAAARAAEALLRGPVGP
ncbi:MAG: monovalent cation/H+ antiporter subunit D family protein [Alphaproteobacteria bacterium]